MKHLLSLACLLSATAVASLGGRCGGLLQDLHPQRQLIRQVRDAYHQQSGVRASLALGSEHLHLNYLGGSGDHVISLGSGPDVLRPLFDFQQVGHVHLMDTFEGWGSSEAYAMEELFRRLNALAEGDLELVSLVDHTQVWRVRWGAEISTKRETFFHIHKMSFNDIAKVALALQTMGPLTGIFTCGAPLPSYRALKLFLAKLESGHPFIFESFKSAPTNPFANWIPFSGLHRWFVDEWDFADRLLKQRGYVAESVVNDDSRFGFSGDGLFARYSYIYTKP